MQNLQLIHLVYTFNLNINLINHCVKKKINHNPICSSHQIRHTIAILPSVTHNCVIFMVLYTSKHVKSFQRKYNNKNINTIQL